MRSMPLTSPSGGYEEFVQAYLQFRRFERAHPALSEFYARRYRAYCEIIGCDLSKPPTVTPTEHSAHRALQLLFESTTSFYLKMHASGYRSRALQLWR